MMKGECDVPSVKPQFEPSKEINLYSYVHQAILMPEDGKILNYIYYLFDTKIQLLFVNIL